MPYNTTAIPPRKEPTGQAQLPLSRIKKVIAQDPEVHMCSNNAAFIITLAAEMFIQHLAEESHTQAKVDTKPRRNIQYKDVANAVARQDNLEFLEDVVPKTVPFKSIKHSLKNTQSRPRGETATGDDSAGAPGSANRPRAAPTATTNGDGSGANASIVNGDIPSGAAGAFVARPSSRAGPSSVTLMDEDPNDQLETEMRQAAQGSSGENRDGDVQMTG